MSELAWTSAIVAGFLSGAITAPTVGRPFLTYLHFVYHIISIPWESFIWC